MLRIQPHVKQNLWKIAQYTLGALNLFYDANSIFPIRSTTKETHPNEKCKEKVHADSIVNRAITHTTVKWLDDVWNKILFLLKFHFFYESPKGMFRFEVKGM